MKRINSIFYSLQGEGHNTGRAAAFIRFAGCNLNCAFCDTDFSNYAEMTDEAILDAITKYHTDFVVITGGEPTLQVDEHFIELLHSAGFTVAMETNGTKPYPQNVDWATVSPKQNFVGKRGKLAVTGCNELKCVFDGERDVDDFGIHADYYYLQPCDVNDPVKNKEIMRCCVDYILKHPKWRLSLQTHKIIGIE